MILFIKPKTSTQRPIMSEIIAYQLPLRPALPTVYGSLDYREYRRQFELIDELLSSSKLVDDFIKLSIEHNIDDKTKLTQSFIKHSECALRCTIARLLTGESYRGFAERLADSQVLQWFCKVGELGYVKVPSKSTLQRYLDRIPSNQIDKLVYDFLVQCGVKSDTREEQPLGLEASFSFDQAYMDSTCVEANIHFPVDWVLLKDATRTLMKAPLTIRARGLKHRMRSPERFISEMNALCMKMSGSYRKAGAKKARKKTLRSIQKLVDKVAVYARNHLELLNEYADEVDLHPGEIHQISTRIQNILEQLPAAKKQAYERIIGERPVANKDKLFSLYEPDTSIIVRKKAGKEVEFGNLLTLVEQEDGLIIGWHLHKELTSDQNFIPEQLDAIKSGLGRSVASLFTDRGYDSAKNDAYLENNAIYNGICPKSPQQLKAINQKNAFVEGQKRRAQTEARIGIFKNAFLNNPMKCKGFEHCQLTVSWAALGHNLWLVAKKLRKEEIERERREQEQQQAA